MNFQETQLKLKQLYTKLICIIKLIHDRVENTCNKNVILNEFLSKNSKYDFKSIIEGLESNLGMIERDKMKCVFVGKTSNGKSCVINALLGSKILPSSMGRSTSCFINVTGTDENVGFLVDRNDKKLDVTVINQLANELSQDRCDIESMLRVFLPRNQYDILRNDVDIVDCPGSDYTSDNDSWIIKYCEDADVFVLVLDGGSTLNDSETALFMRLKRHISKPNVIVLINKWDLVEAESLDNIDKIRMQHLDDVSDFLVNVLKIYSSNQVGNRIFFVSASQSLQGNGDNSSVNNQFIPFTISFENELNIQAIENKFRKHYRKGQDVVNTTLGYLSDLPHHIIKTKTFDESNMNRQILLESKNLIDRLFDDVRQESQGLIDLESLRLAVNIAKDIETNSGGFERLINLNEEYLAAKICEIFNGKINTIRNELHNIFMKHSCIQRNSNQIDHHLNLHLNLEELIRQYKDDIHSNVKNISDEMKKVFKPQHTKSVILNKLKEVLKVTPNIINSGGVAVKKFNPAVAAGFVVVGAVNTAVNEVLNEKITPINFEDEISNHLKEFLMNLVRLLLDQTSRAFDEMVTKVVDKYITDQRNMNDLLDKFDDFKKQFEGINSMLSEDN